MQKLSVLGYHFLVVSDVKGGKGGGDTILYGYLVGRVIKSLHFAANCTILLLIFQTFSRGKNP